MLGIGPWEMILIAAVALVVIGPERFPEFARIVLRTIRDLRSYVDGVKEDVGKELRPLRKEFDDLSRHDPEAYLTETARAVGDTVKEAHDAAVGGEQPSEQKKEDQDAPTSGEDAPGNDARE